MVALHGDPCEWAELDRGRNVPEVAATMVLVGEGPVAHPCVLMDMERGDCRSFRATRVDSLARLVLGRTVAHPMELAC